MTAASAERRRQQGLRLDWQWHTAQRGGEEEREEQEGVEDVPRVAEKGAERLGHAADAVELVEEDSNV